ncbi:putative disease resistance protein [Acorus gramineus]|uniref:Disease resistance protein n=1 Tax=Acorus gramineus TaxID=55184 RepID=A0AAV9ATN3_ACOGR|nr:putative disease resistance protein [Acorus gramineus]
MAKAGVDVARGYPDELIDPANIIVERCGRERSFLTAIGGILWSRMQTATEWSNVANKVQQWNRGMSGLFYMCMDDLPPPLLFCFLHFKYFLGKSVMDAKTIIRLWVAEGFIQPTEEKTAEEVAEIYLEELIHRNMLQIVSMNDVVGGVETCRFHDVFKHKTRFISVEFDRRSIVQIKPPSLQPEHLGDYATVRNKVVHCLGYITTLSKSKMHKLRYLNIQHSGGDDLKDIRYLRRLQTLSIDFRCGFDTQVNKVMIDLSQIRKLRHLILLHKSHPNEKISLIGLETAKYLQTLEVPAGDWIERALDKLTNLRTLKIRGCKDSHGEALKNSLIKLTLLTTLHLIGEGGFPGMHTLSSLIHLIELEMGSPLNESIPPIGPIELGTNVLPPNLKKLTLWRCELGHYLMRLLGNLDDLRYLQLYKDRSHLVDDEVWHMRPGDFPKLQVLDLVGVERVVEWSIDEGALPHLRQLSIVGCRKLKKLPNGLKHISTLRRLELSKSFEERVKRDTGEDWNEIKHVPEIDATYMDLDINRNLLLL